MDNPKIILLLILILLLGFALLVGGIMPYFLLYVFILIFLLPLIHSLIILRGLKGFVKIPNTSLYTGESVNIDYQINNNSFLPIPYMEIQSDIIKELTGKNPTNEVLSLNKKGEFIRRETLSLKRRGYYEIGEIRVILKDVFGLYTLSKLITNKTSLLVYPEIIHLSTFKITTSQESGDLLIRNSMFQDKNRVISPREYREGDSIKSIHWKLTAKRDIPMVKEYENRGDANSIIFINNEGKQFKNDIDRRIEDRIVDISLSIVDYCLDNNIGIALVTQDGKKHVKVQGSYKSDLKPFLEALARFKGNGLIDFKSLLLSEIEIIKKGSTILIVTPILDKSMGAYGLHLKIKNLYPLFIVVTDGENENRYIDHLVEERLKQEGIPVNIIDYSTSVREALEV